MYSIAVKNKIKYHKLCFTGRCTGAKHASLLKAGQLLTSYVIGGGGSTGQFVKEKTSPAQVTRCRGGPTPSVSCSYSLFTGCATGRRGVEVWHSWATRNRRPSRCGPCDGRWERGREGPLLPRQAPSQQATRARREAAGLWRPQSR